MRKRKWLTLVLAVMMLVGLIGGTAGAEEEPGIFLEGIFGINRNTAEVWTLDPDTGAVEFLFDTGLNGSNVGPNGLAYDIENGFFYYATYTGPASQAQLHVYDGVEVKFLYDLGVSIANACFYDGKYYYFDSNSNDDLYEVVFDADGEVDVVNKFESVTGGQYGWTFNGDIAICEDGLIYGHGRDSSGLQFFTVERDGTGFNLIKTGYPYTLQLAFDEDGRLIGHDNSGGKNHVIDTVTGELSDPKLSTTADGKLFTDMAQGWVSEPPPPCDLRTQGYWKNHPEMWPEFDLHPEVDECGTKDDFFGQGTWMEVLWTPPRGGDTYYILAHQFIAAFLNVQSGCVYPEEVGEALYAAGEYFHGEGDYGQFGEPGELTGRMNGEMRDARAAVLSWAEILDNWNNGF